MKLWLATLLFLSLAVINAEEIKLETKLEKTAADVDELTYTIRQLPDGKWVKTGLMVMFYKSGMVESIQTIKDDVLNGMSWEYFPNGNLASRGLYNEGKPVGVWRIWKLDGTFIDKDCK